MSHDVIARRAYRIWEEEGGLAFDNWLLAERLVCCPHCRDTTMGGLPPFTKNATTVCPTCTNVVIFRDCVPSVPTAEEDGEARKQGWIRTLLRAFDKRST